MRSVIQRGLVTSVLSFLVLAGIAPAIGQTIPPAEALRLYVDFARFRGDEKNMFVEVYYSVPQSSITYKSAEGGFKGGIVITLVVLKRDSMVYGDKWAVPHTIKDSNAVRSGMNLVGLTNVGVPEGEYVLKMLGQDENNPSRKDSVSLRLPVRMVGEDVMAISDLELASSIKQQGSKTSPFYKNTLEVVPAPEGLFGEDQRCFLYAEAYNLLAGGGHSEYFVKTVVLDAVGRELVSRELAKKRTAESSVIVDNVTIDQLKSGTYSLVVGLLDSSKKVICSTGKKFFVFNKKLGVDSSLVAGSRSGSLGEYAGVSEADLDREFDWARYEANDAEKTQFKGLHTSDAKRKFLADFWQRRPLGFKEEYLKRVAYANSKFGIMGRRGFLTDRGRVYIVYGPPDDNDRHPNESELRPYEVWTYNDIQGGVIFAFVQRSSTGDYELVHSTHRNELHDDNWMQYAQTK